ncbi:MAG: HDOD domain-containing protein [Desulfobacteraceae bacterium]|nr:HDOD domain-containing protein [Desulfobacteraceae bacterium]
MTPIQELIKEIRQLTPMSSVVNQIMEAVDEPGCSMEDIANIVQYDPAMTANILRTCNSAYFGLPTPIESIRDAVSILGLDQILELVMLKAGSQAFAKPQKGYEQKQGMIWKSSVSSALIAKELAKKLCPDHRNTIFTAALLKDIGKTVLDRFIASSREKITALVRDEGYSFREAEKKVIGIDHAELGAMIMKMWKFSPRMVKIIRHHHLSDPSMQQDPDIAIVYLSDCICMMTGMGTGADGLAYRFHDQVVENMGLASDDIMKIIAEFTQTMEQVEGLLQIV